MKIIIVDDEITSLQVFLTEIINNNDIDYKFFKDNANEIIEYVKENDINCAFLDINMPNINGIELAGKLITINPKIKIVFVTGLSIEMKDLNQNLLDNVLGFIYKPYTYKDLDLYISMIASTKQKLICKMFNNFDCFLNGKLINFSSSKSKELFALLLTYNGKSLEMNDAISQLWPDKDLSKSKILYRDAVWRLRHTMSENNLDCITFKRAELVLNKENIECDYWDYLNNKNIKDIKGIFCKSYNWASEYLSEAE